MVTSFALVDCNNFYVSCERVFQPKLKNNPVLVLSSNDGCVIARSDEVKALGVKMGQPYFQLKPLIEKEAITVFSSNFALYGDMSARMGEVLQHSCDQVEIYSIDEAFLKLEGIADLSAYATRLGKKIKQSLGLPVSIGIGPTKTLAKIANQYSKQNKILTAGVFDISKVDEQNKILSLMPVQSVWGVGRQWNVALQRQGILNAKALRDANLSWIKQTFGVTLERTVRELKGEPCIEFEFEVKPNQQIIVSRSFGELQTEYPVIRSAIATHAASAAAKLRRQGTLCRGIYVYARTNPHRKQDPQYKGESQRQFLEATDDSTEIMSHAMLALKQFFKQGYRYKKAGVILYNICAKSERQMSLFQDAVPVERVELMNVLDEINVRFGRGTLRYGVEGFESAWKGRRDTVTPGFTTKWDEIPIVKAI